MASYEVRWKRSAEKDLRKLDPHYIPQIIEAVESLANDPFGSQSRKLHGAEHTFRVRVRDYRVVYQADVKTKVITIYHNSPPQRD
jgi:mRNA interferase RelE/StbE